MAAAVESKSRTVYWGYGLTVLTLHKDRVRVSAEVSEAVDCNVAKVVGGVELAEMAPHRTGLASVRGLTKCADSEKVMNECS